MSPLRRQTDLAELPDLTEKVEKINAAIRENIHEKEKAKKNKPVFPPETIVEEAHLSSLHEAMSPPVVEEHFEYLLRVIFEESENAAAVEKCLNALIVDIQPLLENHEWKKAADYSRDVISILNRKNFALSTITNTLIRIFENNFLKTISPVVVKSVRNDDYDILEEIDEVLKHFHLTRNHVLIEILIYMEERYIRRKILDLIIGSEYIPHSSLMKMLGHDQWYVVRNAVTLIAGIAEPEYVPLLEKPMKHPQPNVRREVVYALGRIGTKECLNLLFRMYNDSSQPEAIRSMAVASMAEFDDFRARNLFLEILEDSRNPAEEFEIRLTAIKNLGRYKDPEIVKNLLKFIKKPHLLHRKKWDELKKGALEALEKIGTIEARGALLQADKYLKG